MPKPKRSYYYQYDFDNGNAQIVRVKPDDEHPTYCGEPVESFYHYFGPFPTVQACRSELTRKLLNDIAEIRGMLKYIKGPNAIAEADVKE